MPYEINVPSEEPTGGYIHHQEGDAANLLRHIEGVRLVDGDGGEGKGAQKEDQVGKDNEEVDEDVGVHHEDVPADATDEAAQLADDARPREEDEANLGPSLKEGKKGVKS